MTISLETLGLSTLELIKGGVVIKAMDAALTRVASDIAAAPDVEDWREATLKIRAKPCPQTEDVLVELVVKPVKLTERVTSLRAEVRTDDSRRKRLIFNIDSPDSVDQHTLFPREGETT